MIAATTGVQSTTFRLRLCKHAKLKLVLYTPVVSSSFSDRPEWVTDSGMLTSSSVTRTRLSQLLISFLVLAPTCLAQNRSDF